MLSIQESITRLRAEIIVQDWKLSPQRAEMLKAAFACLRQRFKNRKTPHDILIMADYVLNQGIKNNYIFIPPAIDFLKEAMAHVVSLYEDPLFDPDRETKLLKTFQIKIKKLLPAIQQPLTQTPKAESGKVGQNSGNPTPPNDRTIYPGGIPPPKPLPVNPLPAAKEIFSQEEQQEIEQVMNALKNAVYTSPANDTDAIRRQLEDLLDTEMAPKEADNPAATKPARSGAPTASDQSGKEADNPISDCPETPIRLLTIGKTTIGIPDSDIALISPLSNSQRARYLKSGSVPLNDFSRFMKNLARQFKGPLSKFKESILKQMTLPVMTPMSIDLPAIPDETATALIVVGDGQWNGVILCAKISEAVPAMTRFQKARNGDISGFGYLKDSTKIPLLNVISVLRREGFLTVH